MNMRERIARRLCLADGADPDKHFPRARRYGWELYVDNADAVLKEMMEPTEGMLVDAGTMNGFDIDGSAYYEADKHHIDWWKMMIRSAIEGK